MFESCIYDNGPVKIFKTYQNGVPVAIKLHEISSEKPYSKYNLNINHLNIVRCYGITEIKYKGKLYRKFTLEWLEGEDLKGFIYGQSQITIAVLLQILKGIEMLHHNNIILVKENNILIPKIFDYNSTSDSSERKYFVTPEYSSPEFTEGPTIQTDIWAIGCILYEIFTGETLFQRAHVSTEIFNQIRSQKINFNSLKHIPEPFRYIIFKSLQKDPSKRFKNIAEIMDVLKNKPTLKARFKMLKDYLALR